MRKFLYAFPYQRGMTGLVAQASNSSVTSTKNLLFTSEPLDIFSLSSNHPYRETALPHSRKTRNETTSYRNASTNLSSNYSSKSFSLRGAALDLEILRGFRNRLRVLEEFRSSFKIFPPLVHLFFELDQQFQAPQLPALKVLLASLLVRSHDFVSQLIDQSLVEPPKVRHHVLPSRRRH